MDHQLASELYKLFTKDQILTDQSALQKYGKDWTTRLEPKPNCIVLPKSIEEISNLIKLANKLQFALVPSGGRTGYSGGAVATNHEVIVSLERMNQIIQFDAINRSVVCQAGVITKQLQEFAIEKGYFYPVDFASSGSSCIGGNIATNAGGVKVIHYGSTRNWITGLTVITGKGDVLNLNKGLIKNSSGYDLRQLFIGSEGTLGIIAEATIKLTRKPKELIVILLSILDLSKIIDILMTFQQKFDLSAFEFFCNEAMTLVINKYQYTKPFSTKSNYYALIELEKLSDHTSEDIYKAFELCLKKGWINDAIMNQSNEQAAKLWQFRENISESLYTFKPKKYDLAVTPSKIPSFINDMKNIIGNHTQDIKHVLFGHVGDGNIHLNILKPTTFTEKRFTEYCHKIEIQIFELIEKYNGTLSAEHGIGLIKRDLLKFMCSEQEIAYMRKIKQCFDPNNIMNPGKLLK